MSLITNNNQINNASDDVTNIRSVASRRLIIRDMIRLLSMIFSNSPFISSNKIKYNLMKHLKYLLLCKDEQDRLWVFYDGLHEFITCKSILSIRNCEIIEDRSLQAKYRYYMRLKFVLCVIDIPKLNIIEYRNDYINELRQYLDNVCKVLTTIIQKRHIYGGCKTFQCKDEFEIQLILKYPLSKREYDMLKERNCYYE